MKRKRRVPDSVNEDDERGTEWEAEMEAIDARCRLET
jgi:hypothetical protein